jgi:type I restriction enzyme S subunit
MYSNIFTIGQICKRFSSGKFIAAEFLSDTGLYPVYGGNGLRGYADTSNFIGECSIIGRQGAKCGNVRYFNGRGYMTDHAIIAITNKDHDNRFLSYKLSLAELGRFSGQAAQPGLSVQKLSRIKLDMPSLSVQRKISSILSAYDSLIENNNKRIRLLEQMAENLYKEWFVRFRFPGHEKVGMENGLPKGWKQYNLFDIADVTYGYAFKSDLFTNDGSLNAVVRIRDIQGNTTNTFTSEECPDKYLIEENAILIGMDGIFHMCLWNGDKAYLNQRVVKLSSKNLDLCNYLLYLGIRPQVKFWEQVISGTTVAHLGDKHLKRMMMLLPTDDVLHQANNFINGIMVEKNKLLQQNASLTRQRDLLLPRLMSGKLEVM